MGDAVRAGVGLVLEARGRGPSYVAELAPGGSADRSGRLRVGDQLLSVNGQAIQGMTPAELSQIISGPEGSSVRLAFRRITSAFFQETEDDFEITLVRAVPQGLSSRFVVGAPPLRSHPVAAAEGLKGDATAMSQTAMPTPPVPSRPSERQSVPSNLPWQSPPQQQNSNHEDYSRPPTIHGLSRGRDTSYSSPDPAVNPADRRPPVAPSPAQQLMTAVGVPPKMHGAIGTVPFPGSGAPDAVHSSTGADRASGAGSDEAIEAELHTLLTFVKSGYTNATHQESEWMRRDSGLATLLRTLYREIGAIKSREASSENVLRVAKETLDARKKQIRNLTVTLKKLQGQQSLAGLGLSGSMDGASSAGDGATGEETAVNESEQREHRAMEAAASAKRKLQRALLEIADLRAKVQANEGHGVQENGAQDPGTDGQKLLAQKDAEIQALEEKLKFLEEDHRQRSERITEVSERLMLKRKEERDMIDNLRMQLAEKDETIRQLQAQS